MVRNGLLFNGLMKLISVKKAYMKKPSREAFEETFDRMTFGNNQNVINQLRLILTPLPEIITVIPDLRIHAQADLVIGCPREPL
jgi:hypothetical protein